MTCYPQGQNASSVIKNYTPYLQVTDTDDMPGQICGTCFQRIDQWYSFKQVCHNSFDVLRHCVKGDKKDVSSFLGKDPYIWLDMYNGYCLFQ